LNRNELVRNMPKNLAFAPLDSIRQELFLTLQLQSKLAKAQELFVSPVQ